MKAVKILFTTFHMSTFRVSVFLSRSITTLMPICTGNMRNAYGHAQAGAMAGAQPMSRAVSWMPVFSTNACAATPTVVLIKLITMLMPTRATPRVRPAEMALPGFMPTMRPMMNMTMGRKTAAPRSMMLWKTLTRICMLPPYSPSVLTMLSNAASSPLPTRNGMPFTTGMGYSF